MGTIDGRRSLRVLMQVPLAITANGHTVRGHTLVVNRQGALVLLPLRVPEETLIKVQNPLSGTTLLFRVAFCGGEELPGLFKLGIEIMGSGAGFWGSEFETRLGAGNPPPAA